MLSKPNWVSYVSGVWILATSRNGVLVNIGASAGLCATRDQGPRCEIVTDITCFSSHPGYPLNLCIHHWIGKFQESLSLMRTILFLISTLNFTPPTNYTVFTSSTSSRTTLSANSIADIATNTYTDPPNPSHRYNEQHLQRRRPTVSPQQVLRTQDLLFKFPGCVYWSPSTSR
jgi:hypothetical protein